MASSFYARWVPPTKDTSTSDPTQSSYTSPKLTARKRSRDETQTELSKTPKKRKKSKVRGPVSLKDAQGNFSNESEFASPKSALEEPRQAAGHPSQPGENVDNNSAPIYQTPRTAHYEEGGNRSKKKSKKVTKAGGPNRDRAEIFSRLDKVASRHPRTTVVDEHEKPDFAADKKEPDYRKKSKKKRGLDAEREEPQSQLDDRHEKIRERFRKSLETAEVLVPPPDQTEPEIAAPSEHVETHGLVPLPQPPPAPDPEDPSFSGLPHWIAQPTRVPPTRKIRFNELDIDGKILATLKTNKYEEAFAVQSTVIPMLLDGQDAYKGDICISAATGSGKTLAYVLPIIESLRHRAMTQLRALIVVPTRELVKQIREVCELVATGTGLQIGTAIGSKSLKSEQDSIMERRPTYDPIRYQHELKCLASSRERDPLSLQNILDSISEEALPFDHVPTYDSKVDILICTPGRLVDHIRSTRGFSLESLRWLVIDEADRLLNESFQEWVEIVMPALHRSPTCGNVDKLQQIIKDFRLPDSKQDVRKIICSATMTRDVTKLNSLNLHRPRLIVADDIDKPKNDIVDTPVADEFGNYTLPATLKEYAITVAEESLKPLYLLELLLHHVKVLEEPQLTATRRPSKLTKVTSSVDSCTSSESDSDVASTDSSGSDESSSSESSTSSESGLSPRESKNAGKFPCHKPSALIFTSSTSSTHRLYHLLRILDPSLSKHMMTLTRNASSKRTISSLTSPTSPIRIAIATDRASRGIDIPRLGHVISYDVVASLTAYVHRVGRTARAGREGCAWNLVSWREGKWWWNTIGKEHVPGLAKRETKVKRINVDVNLDGDLRSRYEEALRKLEEDVKDEGKGSKRGKEEKYPM